MEMILSCPSLIYLPLEIIKQFWLFAKYSKKIILVIMAHYLAIKTRITNNEECDHFHFAEAKKKKKARIVRIFP